MRMESGMETLCREKEQELQEKYFGNLVEEVAVDRPESVGQYALDLPSRVEAEFRSWLEMMWTGNVSKDTPLMLEEQKLRELMTEGDRRMVEEAYEDAARRTLWEWLTSRTTRMSPITKACCLNTPAICSLSCGLISLRRSQGVISVARRLSGSDGHPAGHISPCGRFLVCGSN